LQGKFFEFLGGSLFSQKPHSLLCPGAFEASVGFLNRAFFFFRAGAWGGPGGKGGWRKKMKGIYSRCGGPRPRRFGLAGAKRKAFGLGRACRGGVESRPPNDRKKKKQPRKRGAISPNLFVGTRFFFFYAGGSLSGPGAPGRAGYFSLGSPNPKKKKKKLFPREKRGLQGKNPPLGKTFFSNQNKKSQPKKNNQSSNLKGANKQSKLGFGETQKKFCFLFLMRGEKKKKKPFLILGKS